MKRLSQTHRYQLESLESRRLLSALIVSSAADSGAGSLRAQIAAAASSGDTISFAPGLAGQTITLTSGKLTIAKSLTIQGPGADQLAVSGNHQSPVFWISNSTNHVAIRGLTIADGSCGIVNYGVLTVSDSTLSGNSANVGGAICNSGTLNLSGSTLSGNVASGGGFSLNPRGGAVYSNAGAMTISNCTFFNNAALGASIHYYDDSPNGYTIGFDAYGGAVYFEGTTASIDHCTFVGNAAWGGNSDFGYPQGLGYHGAIGGGQVSNSIVAGNYAHSSPEGDFASLGHNLIGNSFGVAYVASDLLDVNPQLGPLQNNGGRTQTMALLPGSPAINAGDNTNAPAYDQRGTGFPRIVGGTTDVGAFESSSVATKAYIGPTSGGNWSTAANWSPSGVPAAGDQVYIAGKSVNLLADATLANLTLTAGASLSVAANGNRVLRASTLSISADSKLDLNDNALVLNAHSVSAVANYLTSGYANGAWNGYGICSSVAGSTPQRSLGYAAASDLFGTFPATFQGQSVNASDALIRYTLNGDANLDGQVNSVDFNSIATNFNQSGRRWSQGDFNYDGKVNALDFNALAATYGASLAAGSAAPAESSSILVFGLTFAAAPGGTLFSNNRFTQIEPFVEDSFV